MANLLLNANNWKDQAGAGVSPPACWNGTSYVAVNQQEDLKLLITPSVGDVLACMLNNTGGIGTVTISAASGQLAYWTPTSTPALFSVAVSGETNITISMDGGLGCSSDTITMKPVTTLTRRIQFEVNMEGDPEDDS